MRLNFVFFRIWPELVASRLAVLQHHYEQPDTSHKRNQRYQNVYPVFADVVQAAYSYGYSGNKYAQTVYSGKEREQPYYECGFHCSTDSDKQIENENDEDVEQEKHPIFFPACAAVKIGILF